MDDVALAVMHHACKDSLTWRQVAAASLKSRHKEESTKWMLLELLKAHGVEVPE